MIKTASKVSLLVLAGIVVVLAGVAAGMTWRLYQGPMSLRYAMPLMHRVLNASGLGVDVRFADTVLAWDREANTIEIRAKDVEVLEPGGTTPVAGVPEASAELSLSALFTGHLAPVEISLIDPMLSLLRREDGTIIIIEDMQGAGDAGRFVDILLDALRRPASQDDSDLRFFKRLEIIRADLRLHDDASGTEWTLPDGALSIERQEDGLSASLSGSVQSGDFVARLDVAGHYDVSSDVVTARVDLEDVNPKSLPPAVRPHEIVGGVDMLTALTVDLTYNMSGGLTAAFQLAGIDGVVRHDEALQEPIVLDRVEASGRFEGVSRQLFINRVEAQSAGVDLRVDGVVQFTDTGPDIALFADVGSMSVADLKRLWPVSFKPRTREWIGSHILDGQFQGGTAEVNLPPLTEGEQPPADALKLTFRFTGLEAAYLNSMPPIRDAVGFGQLNLKDMTMRVETAKTLSLEVSDADIHVDDLDIRDEQDADITLTIAGDIPEALRLLNHEPLQYPTKFGMEPEAVQGTGSTRARFRFPLIANVELDDVQFEATSTLKNVALPTLFANTDVAGGDMRLTVNGERLEAKGTLGFNGVPLAVEWTENFSAGDAPPSHYQISGPLDDDGWQRLNLPFDDRISGTAAFVLDLRGKGSSIAEGSGTLDLQGARLDIAEFAWAKPQGVAGGARFQLRSVDEGIEVSRYDLSVPGLSAGGGMMLEPDLTLNHAIAEMEIDQSRMTLSVYGQPDDGLEVFAEGEVIDLRPIIAYSTSERLKRSEPIPSLNFGGHFDRAIMENDVELRDMAVRANFIQDWWEGGYMLAEMADGADISFDMARDGAQRKMTLTSGDAGNLLKGLDYYTSGEGGQLTINAVIDDGREGSPMAGEAEVKDILVRKAPVMASILTLASFTGIADTLGGEGIRFERVSLPFTLSRGVLLLDDAGAFGPAIGLTVEGRINRSDNTVDVGGSIIPSYTLNSFLGKIPLIGPIFSGKDGEGLIGFTYRVSGDASDPTVSVNPLSALAPGFLRGIFAEGASGKPEETQEGMAAPVE